VTDKNSTPDRPAWATQPLRWMALILADQDPGNKGYDPDWWLGMIKRTHSDGALISAGGYVAFYPTQIPLHYRSPWMGDSDPFGYLVERCRRMGVVVIGRTDPHAIHQDAADAHPDWIQVDENGQKRRHWSHPDVWVTCALGPYNAEFMTSITREIAALYDVDAVFSNRWAGHGMCYCEHCRRMFTAYCGLDLPRTRNPQDPALRRYITWRQERLFEIAGLWDAAVKESRPHGAFIPNSGGGALSGLDMKRLADSVPLLEVDRQGRSHNMTHWANGKNAKEFRATLGQKPAICSLNIGLEEPYRWKDSTQNPAEWRLWAAESTANGMLPRFAKFSGVLYDHRWIKTIESFYDWHYRCGDYLRNEKNLARVAMVYSQQTGAFYGGQDAQATVEDHTLGYYQALIEARIPFEMVHDRLLHAAHVDQYKTLILPNVAALSDTQCQQLRAFVERGGSLVATFETSLYDEWGVQRRNFGLADLFGVDFAGGVDGPMKNSYLNIERQADGAHHPLLRGLEDAERIINGAYRLRVQPNKPVEHAPLTFVPPYPDLPMEEVYPRQERTDSAEVYLWQVGAGRVVYFPWDIARLYWEILHWDHGKLLRNAVQWATNEESPVSVIGPGVLDVTIWRQKASLTVHLVNLTNPMMMRGAYRELLPVGEQVVTIRLPQGATAGQVRLLRSESIPSVEREAGRLIVKVPSVLDQEIVAVDLV
jgi:hypothetical protein